MNAELHFQSLCLEQGARCPRCGHERIYDLADGRRRCAACGYTHRLSSGRWLSRVRLTPVGWREALHCFEKGVSVRKAAEVMAVNYDTAFKSYKTIRLAILAHLVRDHLPTLFDADNELIGFCPNLDHEELQALCGGCRSYVFGLRFAGDGRIRLDLVEGLKARELLAAPVLKRVWHSFIHTDRVGDREAMVFACCRRGRELFSHNFTDRDLALDRGNGFKRFAGELLTEYRTMRPEAYPLYLAEAVFRYNHRHGDFPEDLARLLCAFVPNRG